MKGLTLLLLVFSVLMSAIPGIAQDIANMRDFVERGRAGALSNAQVDAYAATWGESEWREFYRISAEEAGMPNPEEVAKELINEDKASMPSTMYYSFEIYRIHSYHSAMLAPHYWLKDRRSCDEDDDHDYMFHFHVSARNVENMRWYSTDSLIGIWIGGFSGRLKAFGTSEFTRICIGDSRICLVDNREGCDKGAKEVKDVEAETLANSSPAIDSSRHQARCRFSFTLKSSPPLK